MKSFMFIPLLIAFASAFALSQHLGAQIAVPNSVLSNGGALLSDSSYRVVATVGEPIIGVMGDAYHTSALGFWYLPGVLVTTVELDPTALPTEYRLEQNYPNPFNPTTTIQFALPKPSVVTLKLFNILGREVTTLVDEKLEAGLHKVVFDAQGLPSGVYIYQLRAGAFVQQKKLALVK